MLAVSMGAHLTGASPLIFPASLCNFVAITPLGVSGGMLHVVLRKIILCIPVPLLVWLT